MPIHHRAFTLAELLIALAIVGVIATFIIPKLLNTQEDTRKKLIFKENIAALSEIIYRGWQDGSIREGRLSDYVLDRLNAIKLCPNHPVTDGCYHTTFETNTAAAVMHNGSVITDVDWNPDCADGCVDGFTIDYNGTEEPNTEGNDYLVVIVKYEEAGGGIVKAPTPASRPLSHAMYLEIFE